MHCAKRRGFALVGLLTLLLAGAAGCGSDDDDSGEGEDGDILTTYSALGTVVDFETGDAVAQATVTTSGLVPAPRVVLDGASFEIQDIPANSVFNVLAGSPPDYQNTYSAAIDLRNDDVVGIVAPVVSRAYLAALADAFAVSAGEGAVLFARALDEAGNPLAGVGREIFQIDGLPPAAGPYFVDEALAPAPGLNATSGSGYAIFFQVNPGLVTLTAVNDSGYTLVMSATPAADATVTVADVTVSAGELQAVPPQDVSFSQQVVPIFSARGCNGCHSGNEIGRDLGGLMLDAGVNKTYKEVAVELSINYNIVRVNLLEPEASLMLTMPSAEDPPDRHPNVTFASPRDPDYQTILAWIREGALNN
jgi:hypothetical protein